MQWLRLNCWLLAGRSQGYSVGDGTIAYIVCHRALFTSDLLTSAFCTACYHRPWQASRRPESLACRDAGGIDEVMQGHVGTTQIALLLTALRAKGETVDEIAGAAAAMRRHMTPIRTTRTGVIDTCGTGGDGSSTFNISTAAAHRHRRGRRAGRQARQSQHHQPHRLGRRAGGAGREHRAPRAGGRSVPGRAGHLLLLRAAVAPGDEARGRRCASSSAIRTIFNLLGPLCNPAGAVSTAGRRQAGAAAAAGRGAGAAGHRADARRLRRRRPRRGHAGRHRRRSPKSRPAGCASSPGRRSDFGSRAPSREALLVDDARSKAPTIIRRVLAGEPGPARDIVVLNAAAALWTAGQHQSLANRLRRGGSQCHRSGPHRQSWPIWRRKQTARRRVSYAFLHESGVNRI